MCIVKVVIFVVSFGLKVNVGYGLIYYNVKVIVVIFEMYELNIGYVIIGCVVMIGLKDVVVEMKCLMLEVCG